MGAMKEHEALKLAAEAAEKSLVALDKDRAELVKKLERVSETIAILQNVVAGWKKIDPQANAQRPLLAEPTTNQVFASVRGEITDKVAEIMSDRQPRNAGRIQAEIKRRWNIDASINAVSVALRRGVKKGKYEKQARGEYAAL